MRGKVVTEQSDALGKGITPAHAGKSCKLHLHIYLSWDHPRTRGEKLIPTIRICIA